MNNRIIKFRVWDYDLKRLIYPEETPKFILTCLGELIKYQQLVDTNKFIIQQFTGLKDKNNKEIYEGDILCCYNNYPKENDIVEVVFESGGFCYKDTYSQKIESISYIIGYNIEMDDASEIIGNIFENPNLVSPPLST